MNCTYRHNNGENVKIFVKFSLHFDKEINSNSQEMEVLRIFQQPLKMARGRIEMRILYSLHGCFWLAGVRSERAQNVLTSIFYLFGKVAVSKGNAKTETSDWHVKHRMRAT